MSDLLTLSPGHDAHSHLQLHFTQHKHYSAPPVVMYSVNCLFLLHVSETNRAYPATHYLMSFITDFAFLGLSFLFQ